MPESKKIKCLSIPGEFYQRAPQIGNTSFMPPGIYFLPFKIRDLAVYMILFDLFVTHFSFSKHLVLIVRLLGRIGKYGSRPAPIVPPFHTFPAPVFTGSQRFCLGSAPG